MSDIHALSGAYAVDALDDIERARFEQHLAECADCRAEVAALREAAGAARRDDAGRPRRPRCATGCSPASPRSVRCRPIAGRRRGAGRSAAPWFADRRWSPLRPALIVLGVGVAVWQPWADDSQARADRRRAGPRGRRRRSGHRRPRRRRRRPSSARKSLNKAVHRHRGHGARPDGQGLRAVAPDHDGEMVPAGLMPTAPTTPVRARGRRRRRPRRRASPSSPRAAPTSPTTTSVAALRLRGR